MSRGPSDSGTSATARRSARRARECRRRCASARPRSRRRPSRRRSGWRSARASWSPRRGGFHSGPAAAKITERREREPQQRQPPRRPRRRLFPRRDVEQEPRRRKFDAARPRRHQPQQPPQHRQRQQPDENEAVRRSRGERPPIMPAPSARMRAARRRARCWPVEAPMRAWSASRSSLGGRSVRWMVKLQPSRSVSARMSVAVAARCARHNPRARSRHGRR